MSSSLTALSLIESRASRKLRLEPMNFSARVQPSPDLQIRRTLSRNPPVVHQGSEQQGEQNASGQSGTATPSPNDDGTVHVSLEISNPPAEAQPAHIHQGTCAELNPTPAFPLESVVNGTSETERGRVAPGPAGRGGRLCDQRPSVGRGGRRLCRLRRHHRLTGRACPARDDPGCSESP